jgi:hypothetical protein
MTPYLHPVSGALTLLALVYAGALGLRLRTARRDRIALARRHARWAQLIYVAVLASWAAGAASVLFARPDLSAASSLHFRSGTAMALLLTGSAVTARLMRRGNPTAREIHPWLGAAAVLLAAAHAVTGLQLTP